MHKSDSEKPLVTFALFAYNQERFIKEAVEGALAQTYSPLEIILSDDCSTDKTFEIMQQVAASYQGPHKIVLNRNPANMGFANHIDHILDIVKTNFVVVAAGDDFSMSSRVEAIVNFWESKGKPDCSIHSAFIPMDVAGNEGSVPVHDIRAETGIENNDERILRGVYGCTHAFSKTIHQYFGPYDPVITCEDLLIPLRAMLLGDSVFYIEEPLVKYRVHSGTLSRLIFDDHDVRKKNLIRYWLGKIALAEQFEADAEKSFPVNFVQKEDLEWLRTLVRGEGRKYNWQLRMLTQTFSERVLTFMASLGRVSLKQSAKWLVLTFVPYSAVIKLRAMFTWANIEPTE